VYVLQNQSLPYLWLASRPQVNQIETQRLQIGQCRRRKLPGSMILESPNGTSLRGFLMVQGGRTRARFRGRVKPRGLWMWAGGSLRTDAIQQRSVLRKPRPCRSSERTLANETSVDHGAAGDGVNQVQVRECPIVCNLCLHDYHGVVGRVIVPQSAPYTPPAITALTSQPISGAAG